MRRSGWFRFALCVATLGCYRATPGTNVGASQQGAPTQIAASNRSIVGVWRVVRFCIIDSAGRQHDPLAPANGYFIYTAGGYVSLQFGRARGEAPAPAESLAGLGLTPDELRGFEAGHVAYFGRYSIVSDSILIHDVEGGSLPSYVGAHPRRRFRIYGANQDTLAIGDVRPGCRVLVRVE